MQPEPVPRSRIATHARRLDPGLEAALDQLGDRRARNQHALIDVHRQSGEPAAPRQIDRRNTLADAPLRAAARCALRARPVRAAGCSAGSRPAVAEYVRRSAPPPHRARYRCRGQMQPRAREPSRAALEHRPDRVVGRAPLCDNRPHDSSFRPAVGFARSRRRRSSGALLARMLAAASVPLETGTWLPQRTRAGRSFICRIWRAAEFEPEQPAAAIRRCCSSASPTAPMSVPTTLADARRRCSAQTPLPGAQVVFVTIDPARDSAATCKLTSAPSARASSACAATTPRWRRCSGASAPSPCGRTCPTAATRWITRRRSTCSIPSARLVAVFSPPFSSREAHRRSAPGRRSRAGSGQRDEGLFVTLQYLLPHHLLCRLVYALTRSRLPLAQERC